MRAGPLADLRVVDLSTVSPAVTHSPTFRMSPDRVKTQVAMRLDL